MSLNTAALATSFARAAAIAAITLRYSHYIPRPVQWVVVFLAALNARNFPLVWHRKQIPPSYIGFYKSTIRRPRHLTKAGFRTSIRSEDSEALVRLDLETTTPEDLCVQESTFKAAHSRFESYSREKSF